MVTIQPPQPRTAVSSLPAYVAGRKATHPDVAALAANESHYPPLPLVVEAITEAAGRVNRYPDMASTKLREKIAEVNQVTSDEVAVGPGSVGVLAQLIAAMCDPGDDVMFAWRSFEAYPILAQVAGANSIKVPLTPDERHDLPRMIAEITVRTKVVLLCSPNNPTGTAIHPDEIAAFMESVPTSTLVVLDEAYREFMAHDLDTVELYRRYPNLCLLRTLSKAYGLAGLRVGYAIAHPEIAEALRRTQIPFSLSSIAEAAGVAALDSLPLVLERAATVTAERERVIAAVRELGWPVPDSEGNFFWLRCADELRERLVHEFNEAGIMVRGYAGDGIRVTVADAPANDRVLGLLAEIGRR